MKSLQLSKNNPQQSIMFDDVTQNTQNVKTQQTKPKADICYPHNDMQPTPRATPPHIHKADPAPPPTADLHRFLAQLL